MGVADDWRDVARRLDATPGEWVSAGAALLRDRLHTGYAGVTGGDRRLSGGGGRINVSVRLSIGPTLSSAELSPSGRGRGPARWVESGTGPRRRQGGSSPARPVWARTIATTLPVIEADLTRRFRAAVSG